MPTTNQQFWPDHLYTAHDQAFGSDVDKMNLALPGAGNRSDTTINAYGTSGNKDITFDPNTTRTTTGIVDDRGFAINEADMDSEATAKRRIQAGTVTIEFESFCAVAALNAVTMHFVLYKVAASPSFARTQIGTGSTNLGLLSAVPTSFTTTFTITEQILEAGETLILVAYANATGQVGGLSVTLRIGDGTDTPALDFNILLPAAIGTRHLKELSVAGAGDASLGPKLIAKAFTVAGAGDAAMSRILTLARSFAVAGSGAAAVTKKSFKEFTVAGAPSSNLRVDMPESVLERISGGGGTVVIAPIFD